MTCRANLPGQYSCCWVWSVELSFSLFFTCRSTTLDDDWDPDCFYLQQDRIHFILVVTVGQQGSMMWHWLFLQSLILPHKADVNSSFQIKMWRWESGRWPMTVETEQAFGKNVQLPRTSQSTVSLTFRVVLPKDLIAFHDDFEFYQRKLTDRQSLISTCCLKRPEMQETLNCSIQKTFLSY